MKIYPVSRCGILFAIFSILPSIAAATPIMFDFTGTISNTILSGGNHINIDQPKQWLGKSVNGSFVLDIDGLETNPHQDRNQIYLDSSYGNNPADWLSVVLANPDGKVYSFPLEDPSASADVDSSVVSIIYRKGVFPDARFYMGRMFSNLNAAPRINISLRLTAWGTDSLKMLNGLDFNTLEIKPEYSDWENYGLVEYNDGAGNKFDYYFTIDSIERREVNAHVDEPSSMTLFVLAVAMCVWVRRRKHGDTHNSCEPS